MFTISEDDSDLLIISLSMLTLQTRAINYIPGGALKLRVNIKHQTPTRLPRKGCQFSGWSVVCSWNILAELTGCSLTPTVGNLSAG